MTTLPEIADWSGNDMVDALNEAAEGVVEATLWGLQVEFMAGDPDGSGGCGGPIALTVYAPDGDVIEPEPVDDPQACMDLARVLVREFRAAEWDAWQLQQCQLSGMQGALL